MARVVLADDHPLFLEALAAAVTSAGIDVVGTASSGTELLEMVEKVDPEAVLVDLAMPGVDGFACIEMLRARHPELQLIAVSASDDPAAIRRSLDAGAVCFIGKSIDPDDLAAAVRALLSDAVHLGANGRSSGAAVATVRTNGSAAAASILTRRELEILSLTSSGMSNSQIARHLWVTEQTVKFHLSNIYRKINVRNRTEASRWAAAHGLLDAQTPSQSSA